MCQDPHDYMGLNNTHIHLILCGSVLSMMHSEVLAYNAPLYGRRMSQFHIKAIKFNHILEFLPQLNKLELMQYYIKESIMPIGTVFVNNRTQAVRLPAETRFPMDVKKVNVRVIGKERILMPVESTWDSFFLSDESVSDDFMNERASQEQAKREPF